MTRLLMKVCTTARFVMMLFMVIVLCAGLVAAAPGPQPKDESLNNYMDLVMDNIQVVMVENGLDPASLPNATMGFSDVVLGVEWHGEANLYDGYLRGLATIHRSSDADFIKNAEDVIIGIQAGLAIGDMEGHYKCLATFMDLGPLADVYINVNGADVYFEALLDPQECKFRAEVLEVRDIGAINVTIEGLSVLGWIIATLIDFVVIFISGFIEDIVGTIVKDITNQVLNSTDLGVLGGILGCETVAALPIPL